ncbi:ABC transporter permease [Sulfurimonas sp. HSL-1716]|uniref:ABC transporter permease n=1 Tax=Hydrocurvibacter sulfurireducens TaxID=3131937 RepID=UPI0031F9D2D4
MMNLAQKDISHTLGKFIVTAMGVGMLLGIVLIMIGVYRGMMVDAQILLKDIHADLWIVQENTLGPFAEASRIHEDLKDTIKVIDGIDKSEALTFQNMQLYIKGQAVRVMAVGFDPLGSLNPVDPNTLVSGRMLQKTHYEAVVSSETGFKLNDRLKIGRDIYTVVGTTRGAVASGGEPLIYISLKDAQQLQFSYSNANIRNDRARGIFEEKDIHTVNAVAATVKKGYDIKETAQRIRRWKHQSVYTDAQQSAILTKNVVEKASKQIGLFTAILVVVSTIIIGLIIYTMTLEKIKEISIMKLIGIPDLIIIKMIVQETVLLGFFAFIFGNIFSHLIYDKFPKRVVLEIPDALSLFAVVLIASVFASFVGVGKVMHADPTVAIGG